MTRSSLKSPRWFAVVGITLLVLGLAAKLAKGRHVIAYEHVVGRNP